MSADPVVLEGPPRVVDLIRDGYPPVRAWAYEAYRGDTRMTLYVVAFEHGPPSGRPLGGWRVVEPPEDA